MIGTEDYCKCIFGRQLKAQHENKVAQAKKEIEETKKMEQATKTMNKKKIRHGIDTPPIVVKEGDWVKHGDVYGIVGEMKGEKFLFMASHAFSKETGARMQVNRHAWADTYKYKPEPLETFDNENQMLIDLALQTGDEEWFKSLTKAVE